MKIAEKDSTVHILLDDVILEGFLNIPNNAIGLVIFSHGSGSGRLSPRNNYVSNILQQKGMATLLLDLLSEREDQVYQNRFDIEKLTLRLIKTTQWVQKEENTSSLPLGYFGASTGAASALKAAAYFGDEIKAVVSRGGRPDLAMDALPKVTAPTLLLVGSWDSDVLSLNQRAYARLNYEKALHIIKDTGHLFEEPGKLREVAEAASSWFFDHFTLKQATDVQE